MPHIHFIAIGGAGIGPLALMAHKTGYTVSGSDLKESEYIDYLKNHGITNIIIGNNEEAIEQIHNKTPIDWIVYSSALTANNSTHPAIEKAKSMGIKTTKRDAFTNAVIQEHGWRLIAIAGTHGKTTTTAMTIWLFKQLKIPISYILAAKVTFGDLAEYDVRSKYFIYEADEFDYNFLSFKPELSLITGVSWDHHEIYKTREEYLDAFNQFISSSRRTVLWKEDASVLKHDNSAVILEESDPLISDIDLNGLYNRRDAVLASTALKIVSDEDINEIIALVGKFPGLSRRMEEIAPHLYSDYAHTPEKIRAAISVAKDMAIQTGQKIIVIYEPLTNRRQTYIKHDYKDCFKGADKIYWLDSYLAREDSQAAIIRPSELISYLTDPTIAVPAKMDDDLKDIIKNHLKSGDMVIAMTGGGGNSLDDWIRSNFN